MSQQFAYPKASNVGETWQTPQLPSDAGAPTVRLAIGPKNWPDYQPVSTVSEHYWMLQKALVGVPMLDRRDFCTNNFASVFDLRRTPGDATSAISTRSGDLLRIDIQNMTANAVTEVHVTLWAYAVCAVREQGITLMD